MSQNQQEQEEQQQPQGKNLKWIVSLAVTLSLATIAGVVGLLYLFTTPPDGQTASQQ